MKKILALVLTVCMLLASVCAFAEGKPVYLALGDSISAGYGLNEGEKNFPEIVAGKKGYTLINHAVNGNTSTDIMEQMRDSTVLNDVMKADVITITCGGNDLLHSLYEYVADIYNEDKNRSHQIQPTDILDILGDPDEPRYEELLQATLTALTGNAQKDILPFTLSSEIQTAMADYLKNMSMILTGIQVVNPDAKIIVCTQYNPYKFFDGIYIGMNLAMESGAMLLSGAITTYSALFGCQVADVYKTFSEYEENLCNADLTTKNLDFHPNAKGHEVIAECVIKAIDTVEE